ncbi:MAG: hypothetical protein E6G81_00720 [Alphaproteobacteria bacterium]|nr:MAG: hypothetical protein E6G81_00720 [Alphaproteobacteria bacterium]
MAGPRGGPQLAGTGQGRLAVLPAIRVSRRSHRGQSNGSPSRSQRAKKPASDRSVPEGQAGAARQNCRAAGRGGIPYKIAIVLMIAAGLRRGESLGLRWRNVDLDPMAERLLALGVRLAPEMTVACNAIGEPLDPNSFGSWARRRGFKLHNLRHAHLSALANSGIPIAAVSKRAGHATIATTIATYVHADDADDLAAAEAAEKLMR